MYGYFYINIYKNPNHKIIKNQPLVDYYLNLTKSYIESNYEPDWILYDYIDKPSNHGFKSFLGMLLYYIKKNDTLVVRSLFQLGNTKVDIYKSLARLRAKQVRLIVNEWEVDISSTMKKVLELSVNDLAVYENVQLHKNHCSDSITEENTYRKLAGYLLDENYISKETVKQITSCNQN